MILRSFAQLCAFFAVSQLFSCSAATTGERDDDDVGTLREAVTTPLPRTGLVPYPVKVGANARPELDANGNLVPAWDGTLADLLAADAFAFCEPTSRVQADDSVEADAYLEHLIGKMETARCVSVGPPLLFQTRAFHWRSQRSNPECNVDTSTLAKAALTDERVPEAHYGFMPGIPLTASSPAVGLLAINEAQKELHVAALNLCMATKLRESLLSADVLAASGAEQLVLLEVIRQRAQIAAHYFAALGLAFSNPASGADHVTHRLQILPPLRALARGTSASGNLRLLGLDFAQAVRLHVDSTTELGDLLFRRAGANADTSDITARAVAPRSAAELAWGPGAWRNRLHNLLYGGDPLGNAVPGETAGNASWGQAGGFGRAFVSEDVRAPEIAALLGLARQADALYVSNSGFAPETGEFIYRDVEANLMAEDCRREDPTQPCTFDASDAPALSAFEDTILWSRHRVRPDHATALAEVLFQAIPTITATALGTEIERMGVLHFLGSHERVASPPGFPATGVDWYHLDSDVAAAPIENAIAASTFNGLAGGALLPQTLDLIIVGSVQGFVARTSSLNGRYPGVANERLRYTGAVAELAAIREAVLTGAGDWALRMGAAPAVAEFYATAPQILGVIDSAIGDSSTALRARLVRRSVTSTPAQGGCLEWGLTSGPCSALVQETTGNEAEEGLSLVSEVSVVTRRGSLGLATPVRDLVALNLGADAGVTGVQATAAVDPEFRSFLGYTRASLDAEPEVAPVSNVHLLGYDRRTYRIAWPAAVNAGPTVRFQRPTLLLRSRDAVPLYGTLGAEVDYRSVRTGETLAVGGPVYRSYLGRYLAYGGTLGFLAREARQPQLHNWARPALDGFRIPVGWVPPSSAELIGASPGEDAVTFYMRSARRAAEEATQAVEDAVENLIAEQADSAIKQAADEKAQTVGDLEKKALCGEAETCSVTLEPAPVELPACNPMSTSVCTLLLPLRFVLPPEVRVSAPVLVAQDLAAAPPFSEFSGGAIQLALVEEWGALRGLRSFLAPLASQLELWRARYDQARLILLEGDVSGFLSQRKHARECSDAAFSDAILAGSTWDGDTYYFSDDLREGFTIKGGRTGESPGPLIAQIKACEDAEDAMLAELAADFVRQAQAGLVSREANAWAMGLAEHAVDRISTLSLATAKVQNVTTNGDRESQLAELDARLVVRPTIFGTARRFHHYDIWRARALLDSARRMAATARRAIEAQYVVDMSEMHADEPFVRAPATWADEVYDFDLDAPSSVGLSSIPGKSDAIYPNKLIDYVGNLEAFVQGYAVARPTSVAKRDSEVIVFGGPDLVDVIAVEVEGATTPTPFLSSDSQGWTFHCASDDSYRPHPGVGEVPLVSTLAGTCPDPDPFADFGLPPDRARLRFRLDAWGRVNGREADPPFTQRHNARWQRMAVNLVGTGIRDCTRAEDPLVCYSESFLRFDLRHVGSAWVTNFERQWRVLGSGPAVIEGGKAIAAEEWLDPLVNGWSQSFVGEASRYELVDRPLGGEYEITIALGPEVRTDRIERVQVLMETDYWVRQD